jgi:hypothetical protein
MMADSQYPWVRRDDESSPAYDAFRAYMSCRNTRKVALELSKSDAIIRRWSSQHDWVERVRAYDQHTATAETDGMVHVLAEFRDGNIELARKLRDHLSNRLDDFIDQRADPTMRWTQALAALAKLEANALLLSKDDKRTDERVMKLEEALAKLEDVDA